jgi:DNA polymerase delta subunit 1
MESAGKSFEHLGRPAVPADYCDHSVCFMFTEVDYYSVGDYTILRVYGVTREGHSVVVHLRGFQSYFWVAVQGNSSEQFTSALKDILNAMMKANAVSQITIELKESIMFYSDEGPQPFFKIHTVHPKQASALRGLIERGVTVLGTDFVSGTYESSLPYVLRFMIDCKITGMCWLECPAGAFTIKNPKTSRAQIELDMNYSDLLVHAPEGEWSFIAPLRILSFDIECNNDGLTFPTPEHNEVIQIGNVCHIMGSDEPLTSAIFTLGSCAEIAEAEVLSYEDEREMFKGWQDFVNAVDPDIITGYNILNFDYNYLFKRAERLRIPSFPELGRILRSTTRCKDTTFQSKAQGLRESKEVTMEGRVQLDMFQHIQKEHKLSQYSLNSVSLHFLKEQKEDVHWTVMRTLQGGNEETRRRIAVYCLKDCYLPLRLLEKLMCVVNYTEMARVTGVPLSYLCTRGQQIKVASQLYRRAAMEGMVIPTHSKGELGDKFEGAFVLDPMKGFYNTPIATLDFASLYPSIMMAHNLCYCTLVPPNMIKKLSTEQYETTPSMDRFVKSNVRKGLLPLILEDLLNARKKAREQIKHTQDPFMQQVLDGRQLALKISANSVYGFTGAQIGQLPCLNISSSVTAYGRQMIEATKHSVETQFSPSNGYASQAQVIYGDTDSVMINFGVETVEEAMAMGKEASQLVTQQFVQPIRLEFEKVYFPYLLITKKRYAGLLWTKANAFDKIDAKGIESVRRDNCAMVRDSINTCLHLLLIQRDVDAAVDYVKRTVAALLQNKIDLSLLVITKALGKKTQANKTQGKNPKNIYASKQAHVELAQRMQARDASSAPSVGDRIAYVMTRGVKGQKAYELAEDPIYALEHSIPIDYDYYVTKQLKNPLSRLFSAILPNTNVLFSGEHTRKRFNPKMGGALLGKFFKVEQTCLNCKSAVSSGALCDKCEGQAGSLLLDRLASLNSSEQSFQELWSECQRCQGSVCNEVLCSNRDCPIFYRREKVKKDIKELMSEIDKFSLHW